MGKAVAVTAFSIADNTIGGRYHVGNNSPLPLLEISAFIFVTTVFCLLHFLPARSLSSVPLNCSDVTRVCASFLSCILAEEEIVAYVQSLLDALLDDIALPWTRAYRRRGSSPCVYKEQLFPYLSNCQTEWWLIGFYGGKGLLGYIRFVVVRAICAIICSAMLSNFSLWNNLPTYAVQGQDILSITYQ
eukprot:Gb_18535 [translate_table: standard]